MSSTYHLTTRSFKGRSAQIPVLITLIVSAACADQAAPTSPASRLASSPSAQVATNEAPEQLAVAQQVPGFGGYFIDESGAPTVYLTDPGRRAEAEAALAGFLGSFGWTGADLRVRQARYDYQQLDNWYRAAWPIALA